MRKRMNFIVGIVAIMMAIMFTAMIVTAHADTPAEPHNADACWVEPSIINLTQSDIGTEFNATVSLNLTEAMYSYQVALHYNRTLLECVASSYTAQSTSSYFTGHSTSSPPPVIDTSSIGNGSVFAGESVLGSDSVPGHAATLFWMEFQVLNFTAYLPASGSLTTKLDISTEYPANTFFLDTNLNNINVATSNSSVTMAPEFPYLLLLPTFMALTLAGAVLSRRKQKAKLS